MDIDAPNGRAQASRTDLSYQVHVPTTKYQPPSTAGVRLAAARVLGRAVASLSLDTAQQSARAKARPRACCWLAVGACPGRRIHSAHSRALVHLDPCACRSARRAMPPLCAFSEVTLPCAGHHARESLLAELPCHALPCPSPCPSSSCAFKQILKEIPILLPRARQSPIVHAS